MPEPRRAQAATSRAGNAARGAAAAVWLAKRAFGSATKVGKRRLGGNGASSGQLSLSLRRLIRRVGRVCSALFGR